MEWRSYEQLTAAIYKALGRENGVVIECYGAQCKVIGKSGSQHQIDVLVKLSNGLQELRTAIECKYWNKKVAKPVIATLAAYIDDAGIEKGVVVSKLGFTEQAIQLAEQLNIGLVELREPMDADWDGWIKEVHVELNISTPEIYDFEVLQESVPHGEANSKTHTFPAIFATVVEPEQTERTLEEIIEAELAKGVGDGEEVEVFFSPNTVMRILDEERTAKVEGVRFKVRYSDYSTNFSVNADNHIYMIMKDLFGKREFTLDHEGNLTERETSGA